MSKFDEIFKSARGEEVNERNKKTKEKILINVKKTKQGRPKGKRSNPSYEQVTAYIKKETHQQIKIELIKENNIQDFSELVEELLNEWLRTQKAKNSKF
jgi:hypothetical protein